VEEVFVDTSYCLALFNPRDSLRDRALNAEENLPGIVRMVTSDLIEIEVLNALSRERQEIKNEAIILFKSMREDPSHLVIPLTRDLLESAERMYLKSADKQWSITDCSSFIIMHERGIQNALTHDHHFEQAGFHAMLRQE
jgi:predicted nucleic acid-binding protein